MPNSNTVILIDVAIKKYTASGSASYVKVLDFGCGKGNLVRDLSSLGYDAYGCDIVTFWEEESNTEKSRLSRISRSPYRLPYEDNTFHVVVSTSVMEHAQNKKECFNEIHRVLKKGGYAMHLYPGKWYLPFEPHIYVPFVNMFWPNCSKGWLSLWARFGIRNEFQKGMSWKEVVEANARYCEHGLSYWSNKKYRKLSQEIYGNYHAPMTFYIKHSDGKAARFLRGIPPKALWGWVLGNIRMNFIVVRKLPEPISKRIKSDELIGAISARKPYNILINQEECAIWVLS